MTELYMVTLLYMDNTKKKQRNLNAAQNPLSLKFHGHLKLNKSPHFPTSPMSLCCKAGSMSDERTYVKCGGNKTKIEWKTRSTLQRKGREDYAWEEREAVTRSMMAERRTRGQQYAELHQQKGGSRAGRGLSPSTLPLGGSTWSTASKSGGPNMRKTWSCWSGPRAGH